MVVAAMQPQKNFLPSFKLVDGWFLYTSYIPYLKDNPHNMTKLEQSQSKTQSELQKFQFSNCLVNSEIFGSTV